MPGFYHFYGTTDVIIVTNFFPIRSYRKDFFDRFLERNNNAMPFPLDLIEDGSGRLNTIISIHLNC